MPYPDKTIYTHTQPRKWKAIYKRHTTNRDAGIGNVLYGVEHFQMMLEKYIDIFFLKGHDSLKGEQIVFGMLVLKLVHVSFRQTDLETMVTQKHNEEAMLIAYNNMNQI